MMRKRAFTLIEVLVTISIFLMVMGLVLGLVITSFRSLREGEKMLDYQQQQRLCLTRLSREISSLVRTSAGEASFIGKEDSFFLSLPERIIW
jgi:prepilin-type N-terminal cleavage/methylation domain-containing protein